MQSLLFSDITDLFGTRSIKKYHFQRKREIKLRYGSQKIGEACRVGVNEQMNRETSLFESEIKSLPC